MQIRATPGPDPSGTERVVRSWSQVLEVVSPAVPEQVRLLVQGSERRQRKTVTGTGSAGGDRTAGTRTVTESRTRSLHLVQVLGPVPDPAASWLDDTSSPRVDLWFRTGHAPGAAPTAGPQRCALTVRTGGDGAWTVQAHCTGSRAARTIGPVTLPPGLLGHQDPVELRVLTRHLGDIPQLVLEVVGIDPFVQGRSTWLRNWSPR